MLRPAAAASAIAASAAAAASASRACLPPGERRALLGLQLLAHPEHLADALGLDAVHVHADDLLLAGLDALLVAERRVGDLPRDQAGLDRGDRAAGVDDLQHAPDRLALDLVGERLDVVRAAERVDDLRRAGLVRGDLLRAQRQVRGLRRRQAERLVVRGGGDRLHAGERGAERLVGDAHHVVQRLLRRERAAERVDEDVDRGLALGHAVALVQDPRPQPPRRAQLRRLLEHVDARREEEEEPVRERRHVDTAADGLVEVRDAVGGRDPDLVDRGAAASRGRGSRRTRSAPSEGSRSPRARRRRPRV